MARIKRKFTSPVIKKRINNNSGPIKIKPDIPHTLKPYGDF